MDELKKFTQVLTKNAEGYLLESTLSFSGGRENVQKNQIFNYDLFDGSRNTSKTLDILNVTIKKQILNDMGL